MKHFSIAVAVATIAFLVLPLQARAEGSDGASPSSILSCFHPSGSFIRVLYGQPHVDAGGHSSRKMQIIFRGAASNSRYIMGLRIDGKPSSQGRVVRMTPLWDSAPFEDGLTCPLTDWQREQ